MPFFNQLRNTISAEYHSINDQSNDKSIKKSMYIDLITGSRGLDIPGLKNVIILLPAFISFTDAKFT